MDNDSLVAKKPFNQSKDNIYSEITTDRNLLIFGPVDSGKSMIFKTLCKSLTVEDEFSINGEVVKLICGKLNISNTDNLFLYTINKQDYSESIWNFFQNEMIGIILLIDNRRKNPLRDLEQFLAKFVRKNSIEKILCKLAIGVTHVDVCNTPEILDYHSLLCSLDLNLQKHPPIF